MSDPFVAEIRMFAFSFPPQGWAFCNGQIMPISQNTALFSLLGTTYGGDGKSTFALPDMRGNAAVAPGQLSGSGVTIFQGEMSGSSEVILLHTEMPTHTHQLQHGGAGVSATPGLSSVLGSSGAVQMYTQSFGAPMLQYAVAESGSSQGHNNRQPYLALNFCIALQGIFPPRN